MFLHSYVGKQQTFVGKYRKRQSNINIYIFAHLWNYYRVCFIYKKKQFQRLIFFKFTKDELKRLCVVGVRMDCRQARQELCPTSVGGGGGGACANRFGSLT
jgi:hypothetical protein